MISRETAYILSGIIGFIGTISFFGAGPLLGLFMLVAGPALAVLVHELGHALAAWAAGMSVRLIAVGPLVLSLSPLRLQRAASWLGHDVGGYVEYDEHRVYLTRQKDILITAAGPLVNFATAIVTFTLGRLLAESHVGFALVGFAFANFAVFVLSALPFKTRDGAPNDALNIVRAVRSGIPQRRSSAKPKRSPWQAP